MKKKKCKPNYDLGGFFKKVGELGLNTLKTSADIPLSFLGAGEVISDDSYKGFGSGFAKDYSSTVGDIGKAVVPGIANIVLPGSGAVISGAQQGLGAAFPGQQDNPLAILQNKQMNTNPYGFANGGLMGPGDPPKLKFDWKTGKITQEPTKKKLHAIAYTPTKEVSDFQLQFEEQQVREMKHAQDIVNNWETLPARVKKTIGQDKYEDLKNSLAFEIGNTALDNSLLDTSWEEDRIKIVDYGQKNLYNKKEQDRAIKYWEESIRLARNDRRGQHGKIIDTFDKELKRGTSSLNKIFGETQSYSVTNPNQLDSILNLVPKGDPIMFLDHHGTNFFGIPQEEFASKIAEKEPVFCIAGTCFGSSDIAPLIKSKSPKSKVIAANPDDSWEGFNPSKSGFDSIFPKGYKSFSKGGVMDDCQECRKANGGYLSQTSPNTQEVIGNNPSQTDGVELPNAYVDHGETISGTSQGKYVFSDILKNPLTGNSFAEDDMKLAKSDKAASLKPYDKEAQNTLKINQMQRENLAKINDGMRILKETLSISKKGMAYGGIIKQSYQDGGNPPWEGFDFNSFYDYVGRDKLGQVGFATDSKWGPQHQKLWDTVGPQYQQHIGYNPTTKTFGVPSGNYNNLPAGVQGMSTINPITGEVYNSEAITSQKFNPITGVTSDVRSTKVSTTEDPLKYLNEKPSSSLPLDTSIINRDNPITLSRDGAGITSTGEPIGFNGDTGTGLGIGNFFKDNAGTLLQGAGFLGRAASVLRKPTQQNLYLNNAPITRQRYDPSNALQQNEYAFNALRSSIGNTVGDGFRMSNLQQAFANKGRTGADIVSKYDQMNRAAQTEYEGRLGQRKAENNQYRYSVDQINDQNRAARNNAFRALMTDLSGLGSEINNQKANKQSMEWLMSAYPDIVKFLEESKKTKK